MELNKENLVYLRTLAAELAGASRGSRGGKVFFDQQWIDEVAAALRVIAKSQGANKS